ncbi:MAG: FtsX-like permease family protein [Verrucomicrobiaceae bacterium]|nr:MAG: FtsX-like permease family protein [Verrucomicrobiaceae bacterium]
MMRFLRYLVLARTTLVEHKLRSLLTVLGIIFGVAAVIAMTAIGEGGKEEALREISRMGIQNIFVRDLLEVRRSVSEKGGYVSDGLSQADLKVIRQSIPEITAVAPVLEKELFVQTDRFQSKHPVRGVDPAFFDVLSHKVDLGRLISDLDVEGVRKVCVLGRDTAVRVFPQRSALGAQIRINGQGFTIVGVLGSQPGYDSDIYIPRTSTVLSESVEPYEPPLTLAILQVEKIPLIPAAADLVKNILLRRHLGAADFELIVPEALFRQQERTRNLFNSIMILITGISLVVGGIGIMNIMLASVLERTREIGIRRGAGATRMDIQMQFLAEAIVLTAAGGVIGVVLGLGLTWTIAVATGWKTSIPPLAVLVAFSFSVIIGVVFGYYPAKNAGRLDPIDALRYE